MMMLLMMLLRVIFSICRSLPSPLTGTNTRRAKVLRSYANDSGLRIATHFVDHEACFTLWGNNFSFIGL
jgi:hypothetical protein